MYSQYTMLDLLSLSFSSSSSSQINLNKLVAPHFLSEETANMRSSRNDVVKVQLESFASNKIIDERQSSANSTLVGCREAGDISTFHFSASPQQQQRCSSPVLASFLPVGVLDPTPIVTDGGQNLSLLGVVDPILRADHGGEVDVLGTSLLLDHFHEIHEFCWRSTCLELGGFLSPRREHALEPELDEQVSFRFALLDRQHGIGIRIVSDVVAESEAQLLEDVKHGMVRLRRR
mmetsp:Transcript_13032/g.45827  ORF Transcript_13032/g.45827 Transcript_13032/m.45827 type:complete len:233 (-) Transcript_13032:831-1529(-)